MQIFFLLCVLLYLFQFNFSNTDLQRSNNSFCVFYCSTGHRQTSLHHSMIRWTNLRSTWGKVIQSVSFHFLLSLVVFCQHKQLDLQIRAGSRLWDMRICCFFFFCNRLNLTLCVLILLLKKTKKLKYSHSNVSCLYLLAGHINCWEEQPFSFCDYCCNALETFNV